MMSRVAEFIEAASPTSTEMLTGTHRSDGVFRSLLVHLAFSDGVVQEEEFELLRRVFPGANDSQILNWVIDETDSPMDFSALSRACKTPEERMDCLRFATQMAAMDGVITLDEKIALMTVANNLDIDEESRDACITAVAESLGLNLT
jgi:uncharacterized membrane protein YebE (DUF533 family)